MTTASYIKQYPGVLAILRDNKEMDVVAVTVFGALTLDCFRTKQEVRWPLVFFLLVPRPEDSCF